MLPRIHRTRNERSIKRIGGLDLGLLAKLQERPQLYENTDRVFWTDPYIAEQILETHLDPHTTAASRPPDVIERSATWILSQAEERFGTSAIRITDLGCGPGLYASYFAHAGAEVTGIDISKRSVEYARRVARHASLPIDYRVGDYRQDPLPKDVDLFTIIYGDFCVLSNRERDALLRKLRGAGHERTLLCFDVFRRSYLTVEEWGAEEEWYVSRKNGFWSPHTHLVLERSFEYEEADVTLRRYIVIEETGGLRYFDMWRHYYDEDTLTAALEANGWQVVGLYSDLQGTPLSGGEPWIGVVAEPAE
jgi:SAM-dependent methyltransferase